ncbi:MAG: hypothetical protein R8G66_31950 [Cytophagales bacterium]|nr:hypothetical protein [Cytophagales bacterium]
MMMKTTITLAVIAMIGMSFQAHAQGSSSVYSTENGKTDFRLTTNMIDADNAYLYNYSENAQTFHTVNIGGSHSLSSGLTVLGNGYVGIGIASPNHALHVAGSMELAHGTFFSEANAFVFRTNGGSWSPVNSKGINTGDWTNTASYGEFITGSDYNLNFKIQGVSRMFIHKSTGYVGIGTTNPNHLLHVAGSMELAHGTFFSEANAFVFRTNGGSWSPLNSRGINTGDWSNTASYGEFITGSDYNMNFKIQGVSRLFIHKSTGDIGIGTTSPGAKLHVVNQAQDSNGNTLILGPGGGAQLRLGYGTNYSWIQAHGGKPLRINELGNNTIVNLSGGLVGIGTSAPTQKLSVNGKINAEEIILEDVAGADFVFEEDYDLRSLEETEQFIQANKHLPEIPSAAEMAEEGLEIKEMNILLLQKVEELTLHLIEQNKQNQSQQGRITHLEKEIEALKNK